MLALCTMVTFYTCVSYITRHSIAFRWMKRSTHFPAVLEGVVECEAGNALRLGTSSDLQGLDNTSNGRVLETGILAPDTSVTIPLHECFGWPVILARSPSFCSRPRHSLGVLADDANVDILVAGLDTGQRLGNNYGGVNVQSLTHGDLPVSSFTPTPVTTALIVVEYARSTSCDRSSQEGCR